MPTIAEVYGPLIFAAQNKDENGHALLKETGRAIFEANPDRCPSVEDGIEAARRNLDYYCQYLDEETADLVKAFYDLGAGFRALNQQKFGFK